MTFRRRRIHVCTFVGFAVALVGHHTHAFLAAPRPLATRSVVARCSTSGGVPIAGPSRLESRSDASEGEALNEVDEVARELEAVAFKSDGSAVTVPAPRDDSGIVFAAIAGAGATVLAAIGGPLFAQVSEVAQARTGLAAAIQPMVDSYAIPIVMGLPPAVLHWSHGGNTFTILAVIGGFGVAEGFAARARRFSGQGQDRGVHSTLMLVVVICTVLSMVGALASMRYDQQPIFESPHAWSALVAFLLLVGNAMIGSSFKGSSDDSTVARDLHAKLGAAWVAAICVNMLLGIWLGLSFSPAAPAASEYSYMSNLGLDTYSSAQDSDV